MYALLSYIIWALSLLLLLVWTIGAIFKPQQMGGEESWGSTNFKTMLVWWVSLLAIVFLNLSILFMLALMPVGVMICGVVSTRALVKLAQENGLSPEEMMSVNLANGKGLFLCLILQISAICFCYLVQNIFT